MVFYLDNHLLNIGPGQEGFYTFLHNILLAYREGKHLLVIAPIDVRQLLSDPNIDSYTLNNLRDYQAHNKAAKGYLHYFSVIVQIIANNEAETVYTDLDSKTEYRKLRFSRFLDTSSIQPTVLLAENGNDAKIYDLLAEYYRSYNNLNSLKVICKKQSGGGDPTVEEYKNIYQHTEEFCLCILDSDKGKPCNHFGSTANKVKVFHDAAFVVSPNYKCHYHILNCLELENLFPREFYEDTYQEYRHKLTHQQLRAVEWYDVEARLYFDFKNGIRAFCDQTDEALNHYWFGIFSHISIKYEEYGDKKVYIDGFGSNIMTDFLKYGQDKVFSSININPYLQNLWLNLGKLICSFVLGLEKRRL